MNDERPDFALIVHPFDLDHLYRYLKHHKPDLKKPGRELLLKLFEWTPPFADRWIEITSSTGQIAYGRVIMCPILPEMVQNTDNQRFRTMCVEKVVASLELARSQGAKISGLGGFTSIADGDQGRLVSQKVPGIAVSSGNTLTAMSAVDGVLHACDMLNLPVGESTATVVGASGDIGMGCCRYLSSRVKRLIIAARFAFNLQKFADELREYSSAEIIIERDNAKAVSHADLVITAASSSAPIFHEREFKPGAIVCDVGYPKNIFTEYDMEKSDIFLFSGGLLECPVPVLMSYDTGLPGPCVIYGCWSETIILALDQRYENFSCGRGNIVPEKMAFIWNLALTHGFKRAPFFFGETVWSDEHIARIRALRSSM